jgi:hypothetical protein
VPCPGQSAFVAHCVYIAQSPAWQFAVIVVMSKQHDCPAPPSVQSAGLWQLKVAIPSPLSPSGLTMPPDELLLLPLLLVLPESSPVVEPASLLEELLDDELHAAAAAPVTVTTRRMRPLRMKDLR